MAESIPPVAMTNRCRSSVLLGAGTVVGIKGSRIFTRPMATWRHMPRVWEYTFDRKAMQRQLWIVCERQKQRKSVQAVKTENTAWSRWCCPAQGGANRSMGAYVMDFYAHVVIPTETTGPALLG